MKLFNSFLFAVALSQTTEVTTTTGDGDLARKRNKKKKNYTTTAAPTTTDFPTTTAARTTTTEEPTTTTAARTTTTEVRTTTEAAPVYTTTFAPQATDAQTNVYFTTGYDPAPQQNYNYQEEKPDNSDAVVAAILDAVVANRPLRPESDEEAAELTRKEQQPDFARYCWRCNVGGNFRLDKAGLAAAQNKCVAEGHIEVCYKGNNGCYTETRLSPGQDGETFLTMVDMGCQDYDQCKKSQNYLFKPKYPQCQPEGKQSHCKNCCEGEKQCNLAWVARRGLNQKDLNEWRHHEY
ncbi:Oidioi.mRNA.OKI2018_I69.chr2.g8422.t1.cds [Oikopleura dioica]|uniref:Oidioi.mRNA.OKI2018_I69.chr2.g8422.t1.cds n=1 Tax=Oikopleura dioica TaxID=34765 RepID=A0ABN7TET2_OIKDI|nr:Oidioi.mRNA.OKI2018_I69.chr2.g8422.t1.cds [Oikopleura dioica]